MRDTGGPNHTTRTKPRRSLVLGVADDLAGPGEEAVRHVVFLHELTLALDLDVDLAPRGRSHVDARDEPAIRTGDRTDGLADLGVEEQELRQREPVEQLRELALAQLLLELIERQQTQATALVVVREELGVFVEGLVERQVLLFERRE